MDSYREGRVKYRLPANEFRCGAYVNYVSRPEYFQKTHSHHKILKKSVD